MCKLFLLNWNTWYHNIVLDMRLNHIRWWGFTSGALGCMGYSFIAITLVHSDLELHHMSRSHWKDLLSLGSLQVTYVFTLSRTWELVASPVATAFIEKHQLDITTDIKHTITENDEYIPTLCLGNATYFFWFRKLSLLQTSHQISKIKFWIERYLRPFPPFLPFLNSLAAFPRKRS